MHGDFYASAEKSTGHLIVKLPKTRLQTMIDAELGEPFTQNGRRFKEWVRITHRDADLWRGYLQAARAFIEK